MRVIACTRDLLGEKCISTSTGIHGKICEYGNNLCGLTARREGEQQETLWAVAILARMPQ